MTAVIHIRDGVKDGVLADDVVYIGNAMPPRMNPTGAYLPRSDWYNPFRIHKDGKPRDGTREEVIAMYERYLLDERPDLRARLPELEGKTLACWCRPQACHGDVLVKLLEEASA